MMQLDEVIERWDADDWQLVADCLSGELEKVLGQHRYRWQGRKNYAKRLRDQLDAAERQARIVQRERAEQG